MTEYRHGQQRPGPSTQTFFEPCPKLGELLSGMTLVITALGPSKGSISLWQTLCRNSEQKLGRGSQVAVRPSPADRPPSPESFNEAINPRPCTCPSGWMEDCIPGWLACGDGARTLHHSSPEPCRPLLGSSPSILTRDFQVQLRPLCLVLR